MRVYIAGPMRGLPHANYPTFDAARDYLISLGHEPVSPVDHDRALGITAAEAAGWDRDATTRFHALMAWDLRQIIDGDAIALLPGWETSVGAGYERAVAEACGKRIYRVDPETRSFVEERPPIIIGFTGVARAGKDTAASALVEYSRFERVSFADRVRAVLLGTDPLVPVARNSRISRKFVSYHRLSLVIAELGWERAKTEIPEVRQLLQRLGTEGVRTHLGPTVWIDAALSVVEPGRRYAVTDVRFNNEAEAIKKLGGEIWRIERPGYGPVNPHASDAGIDGGLVDRVIRNDSTRRALKNRTRLAYLESELGA